MELKLSIFKEYIEAAVKNCQMRETVNGNRKKKLTGEI